MALDFPNPAGQTPANTFSPTSTPDSTTNGLTYTWDGSKWTASVTETYASGPLAGFRNQLINGNLQVNQRGVGATNAVGYHCDRWTKPNAAQIDWVEMQVLGYNGDAVRLINLNGQPNALYRQAIELFNTGRDEPFTVGSTWTLSLLTDNVGINLGNSGLQWATDSAGNGAAVAANGGGWVNQGNGRFTNTFTIANAAPATATCLLVDIVWDTVNAAVGAFQLEPGPVATPFERRPIGTELALCQRYYQVVKPSATLTGNISTGGTQGFYVPYTFKTQLRVSNGNIVANPPNIRTAGATTDINLGGAAGFVRSVHQCVIKYDPGSATTGVYILSSYPESSFEAEL